MWRNDTKCKYIYMFPLKNLACKGFSTFLPSFKMNFNIFYQCWGMAQNTKTYLQNISASVGLKIIRINITWGKQRWLPRSYILQSAKHHQAGSFYCSALIQEHVLGPVSLKIVHSAFNLNEISIWNYLVVFFCFVFHVVIKLAHVVTSLLPWHTKFCNDHCMRN